MKKQWFLLLLLLSATLAAQSPQEVRIRIEEGMPLIPVALPEFNFTAASLQNTQIRGELYETLWNDLDFSRVFKLVPREHYAYIPRATNGQVNFKDWASIQANILLTADLEITTDERIILSFKVYEVKSERFIFGRNLAGKKDMLRVIAHRAADEMMKYFGEKPIFTSKICFVSERDKNKEIYIMDYDGRRQTRITFNSTIDMLPSWSSDNEKILYTSYRRLSPELYLFDIFTGKTEVFATGGANYSADWALDGENVVFASSREGSVAIYVKNVRSGKLRRLTFQKSIDSTPCWSPSGKEIAFASGRGGTPQLYIMDADGANVRRITSEGSWHDSPAWSPDGSRIAFVSRIGNNLDIFIYNIKANEISRLTENAGFNENPSWSPDGRHLVFASNRSGTYQIYVMDYDGTNVRQLTNGARNEMPRWQKTTK